MILTDAYVYNTTITPPLTYDYKIINFGKTIEVSTNAVLITFDMQYFILLLFLDISLLI